MKQIDKVLEFIKNYEGRRKLTITQISKELKTDRAYTNIIIKKLKLCNKIEVTKNGREKLVRLKW